MSGLADRVAVVMPTLPARAVLRIPTVCQMESVGLAPALCEQPADWEPGKVSAARNARAALVAGLATGRAHVLLVEDDVDISPRMAETVARLTLARGVPPVSLWHRPTQRPADMRAGRLGAVPVRRPAAWWSSLALLLPHRTVARLVDDLRDWDCSAGGWDLALRRVGMHITPDVLVEQRRLPRMATRGGQYASGVPHDCWDSHATLERLWEWLPGRRDKRRVTLRTVAESDLGMSPLMSAWAYEALRRMRCAVPDRRGDRIVGWHRGVPLPWVTQDAALSPSPLVQEELCL